MIRTSKAAITARFPASAVLLTLGLCSAATAASAAADPTLQALQRQLGEMQAKLDQLAVENRALREHQEVLDQRLAELTERAVAAPTSSALPPATAAPNVSALPGAGMAPAAGAGAAGAAAAGPGAMAGGAGPTVTTGSGLRLWGYGEIYYAHPTHQPELSQFDLARAVFGIGYRFDERTELNSEYEVEHAVSSASDVGEFEVEQFYIDRRLSDAVTVRAGLLLMPFGFINEHHEPTNFYGMQRNFVETLIIPSTWREGGFNLHGDTPAGFTWNAGLTTGFDFSKWSFGVGSPPPYRTALELEDSDIAPLQATHQELALANAHNLSQYLALGYYGIPGLDVGAAVSTGKAVPVPLAPPAASSGDPRVTLWEAHGRFTPGRWDLAALYARGTVSNTAAANAANPGSPNPVPAAFYGYYLQAAYRLWESGEYRLSPFVRFERYNMGASYEGTAGPDYGDWPQNHDRVWTGGANFYLGPHVVLKGDYQWFEVNPSLSRFDVGLGVSF